VGVATTKYVMARRRMHCMEYVTDLSCVCRGYETATLAIDRLLGDSFATSKVPCDGLKVGRDELERMA